MSVHVCVLDEYEICVDQERDWCNRCEACTVWSGHYCAECGLEWGEEA